MPVLMSRIIAEDGATYDRVTEATTQPEAAKKAIAAAEGERGEPLDRYVLIATEVGGGGADFAEILREFDEQERPARRAFGLEGEADG